MPSAVSFLCSSGPLHVEVSSDTKAGACLAEALTLALSVFVDAVEPRLSHRCKKDKNKVGQSRQQDKACHLLIMCGSGIEVVINEKRFLSKITAWASPLT